MSDFDLTPLRSRLSHYMPSGRSALLPALQDAQELFGYIPEAAAVEIGKALGVPLADVSGVIDFYSMLSRDNTGDTILWVCTDPACALAGGEQVLTGLCRKAGVSPGGTSRNGEYTVERAPCLGLCEHAPAMLAGDGSVTKVDPQNLDPVFTATAPKLKDTVSGDLQILTANCLDGETTGIESYQSNGGYSAYKKTLGMEPGEIIHEVMSSGLVGRGGAAFPTGAKWQSCLEAVGEPKFVVCNADESEPGTFKDRILMELDPHRVIEGTLIAARAVGASRGYIYLRGEYPRARKTMETALNAARQAGFLGGNVLDSGFDIDLELRLGAGAYICGEETALFESIEGKRGMPRIKPPYPTTHGVFGKPTVINNVETLCNVPYILDHGAQAFRQFGTDRSPGPKLFCVSGDVVRPGLFEVPFGVTIGYLVNELAGGVPGDQGLLTVLVGGAAGAFATPDQLDLPLTFEDLSAAGLPLGSGVLMVFDERRDLRDVLLRLSRFFAHESCGKCYPCQLGTQRQYEILQRVAAGSAQPGDAERLLDVGWTMSDASICGLGQTAATAVLSALDLWPDMVGQ